MATFVSPGLILNLVLSLVLPLALTSTLTVARPSTFTLIRLLLVHFTFHILRRVVLVFFELGKWKTRCVNGVKITCYDIALQPPLTSDGSKSL